MSAIFEPKPRWVALGDPLNDYSNHLLSDVHHLPHSWLLLWTHHEMKPQHNITLWLAAGGSLLFAMIALLDPNVTWRDCIGVHIGIWAMALGQCWTQFILNHKTTHEKDPHPTPAP